MLLFDYTKKIRTKRHRLFENNFKDLKISNFISDESSGSGGDDEKMKYVFRLKIKYTRGAVRGTPPHQSIDRSPPLPVPIIVMILGRSFLFLGLFQVNFRVNNENSGSSIYQTNYRFIEIGK